jgi:outer membrane protein assembly factor BamB
MKRNVAILCALVSASVVRAQFGSGDWTTTGFDAQRSFWVRGDPKISLDSMRKPGFELVWKASIYDGERTKTFATPPVLIDFYIGYRGFRSLGFIGTGANSIVTLDTDLGRIEWTKDFKVAPSPASSPGCPGGMTSGVARSTTVGYPALMPARGFGRGTPAKSGVGEPFEGAVTLKQVANRPPPRPPAPAPAKGTRRTAEASNPFAPRVQWLYALGEDGKLHALYISNGEEPKDPISFLPPNAYAKGLIVVDNVAYVATTNGCGGVDNGIWALDLPSSKVTHWKSAGNIAGSTGLAMGPDGTIYTAAGNQLLALKERTLEVRGTYRIASGEFTSSPVVFDYQGKDLIAATSSDGKLHLLDAAAMERPIAVSPAFSAANFATGAIASWRDAAGIRWLLVPAGGSAPNEAGFRGDIKNGAIVAWKVVDRNGTPGLQPGWMSRDMISPITPIVVNGVVFAVSSGEHRSGAAADRIKRSVPAVLYAFDSAAGEELWSSGKTLSSFVTTGGLAAGGSRVYVATQDGTQYVFGFPIEH